MVRLSVGIRSTKAPPVKLRAAKEWMCVCVFMFLCDVFSEIQLRGLAENRVGPSLSEAL